jgi:hypothetical protein
MNLIIKRVIVELSYMKGNKELVFFLIPNEYKNIKDFQKEILYILKLKTININIFDNPRIVLVRNLYKIEFDNGLYPNYITYKYLETPPESTRLIDSYFKIKNSINKWKKINRKITSSKIIGLVIGDVYDCMTASNDEYDLSILLYLAKNSKIDKSTRVYDYQHTIQSFIDEYDNVNIPNFNEILKKLRSKLCLNNLIN